MSERIYRDLTPQQRRIVLDVLWGEAAGEPEVGKVAVLSTMFNNLESDKDFDKMLKRYAAYYTKSPAYKRAASGQLNAFERILYNRNAELLERMMSGDVPVIPGITHFENVDRFGEPPWESEMDRVGRYGSQIFYKPRTSVRSAVLQGGE